MPRPVRAAVVDPGRISRAGSRRAKAPRALAHRPRKAPSQFPAQIARPAYVRAIRARAEVWELRKCGPHVGARSMRLRLALLPDVREAESRYCANAAGPEMA